MATITNIGRIDCAGEDAREAIRELRRQLSPRGDVVSPEGRARTIAAFGEPLTPEQVVARICGDVRSRGLEAVLDYTARLDRVELDRSAVRVSRRELAEAHAKADPAYLRTIRRVRDNILAFQSGILHRDATFRRGPGLRAAAPLSAAPAGRGLHPRRGRGLSLVAPDDGRPGAGGGGRADRGGGPAHARSAATTPTSWPPATRWG